MAKRERQDTTPTKCVKCGTELLKREELAMDGKLGFLGPDYLFDVYICTICGYSELFFQRAKWIS